MIVTLWLLLISKYVRKGFPMLIIQCQHFNELDFRKICGMIIELDNEKNEECNFLSKILEIHFFCTKIIYLKNYHFGNSNY